MKYVSAVLFLCVQLVPVTVAAQNESEAATSDRAHPVISEVLLGTEATASQEFIELYNPSNARLKFDENWTLQKAAASGGEDQQPNWQEVELGGSVEPRGYYLLSARDWYEEEEVLSGAADFWDIPHNRVAAFPGFGLADSGGHIRLMGPDSGGNEATEPGEMDRVAWGEANFPETRAVSPPSRGESMHRRFAVDGSIIDTDDNADDFQISGTPSPTATPPPGENDAGSGDNGANGDQSWSDQQPEEEHSGSSDQDSGSASDARVVVTEVLPDPASPATDARDEFVELYNPTSEEINLEGYVIQTGSDLGYEFQIPDGITIAPHKYRLFYARNASLTLTNSGGRVRVVDPEGNTASNVLIYPDASIGASWGRLQGSFQWSERTTPGSDNMPPTSESAPDEDPATDESNSRATSQEQLRQTYPQLHIREVLPDPADPLTDAKDEFVELHNPTSTAVTLEGYILETGTDFNSSHELEGTIAPQGREAVFAENANMSLVNSGGSARLVGENEDVIDTVPSYPAAETGASRALFDGKWQWTTRPTPAAINKLAQPAETDEEREGDVAAASDDSQTSGQDEAVSNITQPATIETSPYTTASVVISIALAVLYMLYEFRYDIRNYIELTRRYIARWRADRD